MPGISPMKMAFQPSTNCASVSSILSCWRRWAKNAASEISPRSWRRKASPPAIPAASGGLSGAAAAPASAAQRARARVASRSMTTRPKSNSNASTSPFMPRLRSAPQGTSPPAFERLVRAVCGCFAGPAPAVWTGEAGPASDWGRRDRPGTAAAASTTATPICSSRSCCAKMARQSRAALRAVLEDPMTTASGGMELTRVGAGTIMGELMRCYWLPAALSSELVRDGAPVRLLLLGEKLVAFRDSAGRVGVMDHRCPHRGASLFLGRNEEGGLRCIYHGWKFDVAGNCLDMPSLPPPGFKQKVKAKAYQVVERAGVVWVYMGPRRDAPPLPGFEILDLPPAEINVSFIQRDCNYLQALEGEIDTSHFGFLHAGHVDPDDLAEDEPLRHTVTNRAPLYHLAETAWGTQYAGYREAEPGRTYWRFGNFLFPFWTQAPNGEFGSHMHARAWVPLDDEHTMFCFLWWKRAQSAMSLPQPAFKDGRPIGGTGRGNKLLPNTTDWLGRWRMAANPSNDWGLDRAAQQQK